MKRSDTIEASAGTIDPVILEVRARFIAEFPMRCDMAASLVQHTASPDIRVESAQSLRSLAHRVAGLAGIIGFARVSALASDLEDVSRGLEMGAVDPSAAHAVVDSLRAAFAQELATGARSTSGTPNPTDRGHVLVVEDDEDQRAIVTKQLADAGYRTKDVGSGSQVLDAARSVSPSVILLDVEMPGLDGYSVCRQLKADAELATVPVVFMTTRTRLDDRLAGLALGADDYLIKPVDPRELVIRLERVQTRDTARAELAGAAGVLSYQDYLQVARSRLTRSAASVVLMRLPAEHLSQAASTVTDEIRRTDVVATYDRTHLLLLLPELAGTSARARVNELVARLGQRGIDGVAAGIACAPTPASIWIESLICDADEALMQGRSCGKPVAVYGDPVEPASSRAAASVLIADDDPDIVRILDAQLRGAGYSTRIAFDGMEALAALENRCDVLILDLMMPKLGGFDLLATLARSEAARPKVVVLSARGREKDVTRAFELGADDYMTKPFNPQELLARVARLLR